MLFLEKEKLNNSYIYNKVPIYTITIQKKKFNILQCEPVTIVNILYEQ